MAGAYASRYISEKGIIQTFEDLVTDTRKDRHYIKTIHTWGMGCFFIILQVSLFGQKRCYTNVNKIYAEVRLRIGFDRGVREAR